VFGSSLMRLAVLGTTGGSADSSRRSQSFRRLVFTSADVQSYRQLHTNIRHHCWTHQ